MMKWWNFCLYVVFLLVIRLFRTSHSRGCAKSNYSSNYEYYC